MSIKLEIIEWPNPYPNEMIHRYPEEGSADIKLGAQLIVRDTQSAVFYRDGKACDSFGSGRHTLTTFNLPIITKLFSLPWGFESIFKAEVYFINHQTFINLKWGTREPVAFKDSELGLIRLRAYGVYSCKVTEPLLFINQLVGRASKYTTETIEDYLRNVIVCRVSDMFGDNLDTFLNLPKRFNEMSAGLQKDLQKEFQRFGMTLLSFYISSISPPEDVQKMIDMRSGMDAIKDFDKFLKMKLAESIDSQKGGDFSSGASAGGGSGFGVPEGAQMGMGVGVGMGMGMLLPGYLSKAFMPDQKELEDSKLPTVQCPECLSRTPENSRFCYKCGHQMVVSNTCPKCDKVLPSHANFCMSCGYSLKTKTACGKCGMELPTGTKYCIGCGEKL